MRFVCLAVLGAAMLLAGPSTPEQDEPAGVNVNSRYTIEDIEVPGIDKRRFSQGLLQNLHRLIGEKFRPEAIEELASMVRTELKARTVTHRLMRGDLPDHVKVILDVRFHEADETDFHLSKFVYHSKQAWTAKAFGDFEVADNTGLLLGLVSDADTLLERYAGIGAGFEQRKVFSDRVRLRLLFETYHHQWNRATLVALESSDVPGIYRTRKGFQPALTFIVARPLKLSVGAGFDLIETQFPEAHTEAVNGATGSLRYRQQFGGHELMGGYDIRASTALLDSDFLYTRHQWTFGYKITGGRQTVATRLTAGRMTGRAPLYDRYTLGNSTTLRGWNKYDVAPLGGDRAVHNSLEYRHAVGESAVSLVAFYDVGAVWDRGEPAVARHSVGFGARWTRLFAALAFPVKSRRMEPLFILGAYFTEASNF